MIKKNERMQIDENFSITKDTYNITLNYEYESGEINKKGNPIVSRNKWNFGTVEQALRKYLDETIHRCDEISDILGAIEAAKRHIANALKDINQS